MTHHSRIGAVAIGRNEGDRLKACLESIRKAGIAAVYVDSGSSDDSLAVAQRHDVAVVVLDMSTPFTAARARNAGFQALLEHHPDLEYVQFVDGDCELVDGWIEAAVAYLDEHGEYAIICGWRSEKHPEDSVYNRLLDREWHQPEGDAEWCGGDAVVRAEHFVAVQGYSEDLIAGEEPDLCIRLRDRGFRIARISLPMTLHDAQILTFSQWWKRAERGGHAFAQIWWRHRNSPNAIWIGSLLRLTIWGGLLPLGLILASLVQAICLVGFALYPLQIGRLALMDRSKDRNRWFFGFLLVASKFAEAIGAAKFVAAYLRNRSNPLIEYK